MKRHVLFGQKYMGIFQKHEKQLFGVPCEHPLPLPLGEVAERSEDGEGK